MAVCRECTTATGIPRFFASVFLLLLASIWAALPANAHAPKLFSAPLAQEGERGIALSESDTVQLVASRAALEAIEHLGAKQDRYWAILSGIIVFVGVILFFFVGNRVGEMKRSITNELQGTLSRDADFQKLIRASMETSITEYMREEIKRTKQEIAKIRLDGLATELEASDGFSDGLKLSIMELLRIASEDPEILASPSFMRTLERISKNFMRADLSFEIDEIMNMFRKRFDALAASAESRDKKKALFSQIGPYLQHYGQRLIGDIELPQTLPTEFDTNSGICDRIKYRETVLPFLLVWTHGRLKAADKKDDEAKLRRSLKALIQDYQHLKDEEKAITANLLGTLSDETKLAKRPTAQIVRIAERTKAFLSEHGAEFKSTSETGAPPTSNVASDPSLLERFRDMLAKGPPQDPSKP